MKFIHGASLALLLLFTPAIACADEGPGRGAPPRNQTPPTGQTPTTPSTPAPSDDDDLLAPPGVTPSVPATGQGTPPRTGQSATPPTGTSPTTGTPPRTGQSGTAPTGQTPTIAPSGDEDILDPLGASPPPPSTGAVDGPGALDARPQGQGPPPPADAAERARLDAAIREEVERRAETYGAELERVNGLDPSDPATAAEVERFNTTATTEFDEVEAAFARDGGVSEEVEAVGGGQPRTPGNTGGRPGTSGETPVDDWSDLGQPVASTNMGPGYAGNGGNGGGGAGATRMNFWQKLVVGVLEAIRDGVKAGGAARANELKLRSDRIAATTTPEYRAYVDHMSRRAIENSAFGRAGGGAAGAVSGTHDRRLDDLILGNARTPVSGGGSGSSSPSVRGGDAALINGGTAGTTNNDTLRVSRLPRVRDPLTGEMRVMIDIPLGVDPVRPLR